ncbi:MAG: hypothetical protein DRI37_05520 [Chloroflexi bacterium]|nr:MAG: hypothetical protein DRI37_05520 [Chloroflexota bacterium]
MANSEWQIANGEWRMGLAVAGLPTEPQTGTIRRPALSPRRDRPEIGFKWQMGLIGGGTFNE